MALSGYFQDVTLQAWKKKKEKKALWKNFLYFFFFFLIIDLYVLLPAAIAQVFLILL